MQQLHTIETNQDVNPGFFCWSEYLAIAIAHHSSTLITARSMEAIALRAIALSPYTKIK
ncbi:hypothetical protein [Limnofasciculus baicalensis]|uniref:Uncharacterized protein n=1 Tax=Limnofasciculus baicalensis BBK-W-15 TaxID=2699891 RepID=A0AAE3GPK8_9CYAN|nr:hypothetical protein [Limnofasciculus baicalensis]MCP2728330.1 hypothetical protein [Limnofasciculus baicalensis BBK-W-15]